MDEPSPEYHQIIEAEVEKAFREWDDEILALGHPKWCATAFIESQVTNAVSLSSEWQFRGTEVAGHPPLREVV